MNRAINSKVYKLNRSNYVNFKNQSGMSAIGWLVVLAVVAFLANFGFKVIPMYFENKLVVESLKSLDEPGHPLRDMSDNELKKRLLVAYEHNNVNSKGPQNFVFDRKSGGLIIKVDYEARENLILDIDVATKFSNHLDADRPALCCSPQEEKSAPSKY